MVINKNSILYFSGTGNTYDVSLKLAKRCDFELINISTLIEEEIIEINCEIIGVAFPIYYGGVPKIINETIDKIRTFKNQYIFSLATYGGMPGNPFKILEKRLKYQGINLGSGFLINMPGNYIPLNGARRNSVQINNFKNANKKIEEITDIIIAKKNLNYEKSPYIIDRPFSYFSEKKVEKLSSYDVNFYVDNKCINCGMCLRICPVKNISIKNGKITWLGKCEQCMACIQYCPSEAIQFGNKTFKKKRYKNPNVDYLKVLLKER